MKEKHQLTIAAKLVATGLVVATLGVVIQIISGDHYPKIPPVLFMLLIPAGLITFTQLRWIPILAALVGLFLLRGLFTSGASVRLVNYDQFGGLGGSIGLWIQTIGDLVATVASLIAIIENYWIQNRKIQL